MRRFADSDSNTDAYAKRDTDANTDANSDTNADSATNTGGAEQSDSEWGFRQSNKFELV